MNNCKFSSTVSRPEEPLSIPTSSSTKSEKWTGGVSSCEGSEVGSDCEGSEVGVALGSAVGSAVGTELGSTVGEALGSAETALS